MNYDRFLEEAEKLEFVPDRHAADSMVKAALGMLASRLDERHAREFTSKLPGPLDYDRLRGHQAHQATTPAEYDIRALARQFNIGVHDAERLMSCVLAVAREAVGAGTFEEMEHHLPANWPHVLHNA